MLPLREGSVKSRKKPPWGWIAAIAVVAVVGLIWAYFGLARPLLSSTPSSRPPTSASGPRTNSLNIAASTATVLGSNLLGPTPKYVDLRFDADLLRYTYPSFNLEGSDFAAALTKAAATGHQVLAIADDYAPSQVAQDPGMNCQQQLCALRDTPAAASAYARFAVRVAAACMSVHPHCVAEELGNEPNVGARWGPLPDPDAYARAISVACPAIKAATHDGLTVVLGGLANVATDSNDYTPAGFYSQVVQWFNARHLAHCWDAVGMHPYGDPTLSVTGSLYAAMRSFGDGAKKIWATEVGTGGNSQTAAGYFSTFVQKWFAQVYAGPLFWFSWNTDSGQTGIDSSPPFLATFKQAASQYSSRP